MMLARLRLDLAPYEDIIYATYDAYYAGLQRRQFISQISRYSEYEIARSFTCGGSLKVPFGSNSRQCQTIVCARATTNSKERDRDPNGILVTAQFKTYGRAGTNSIASVVEAAICLDKDDVLVGNDESAVLDACLIDSLGHSRSWLTEPMTPIEYLNSTRMTYYEATKCNGQPPRLVVNIGFNSSLRLLGWRRWRSAFKSSSWLVELQEAVNEESMSLGKLNLDFENYRFNAGSGIVSADIGMLNVAKETGKYLEKPEVKHQVLDLAQRLVSRRQARVKEPGWAQYAGLDNDEPRQESPLYSTPEPESMA